MPIVKLDIIANTPRPVFRMYSKSINVLVDTGSTKAVWNAKAEALKMRFGAKKTQYWTTISGYGGVSNKRREIWRIPEFILEDKDDSSKKYIIKGLLVAVVDDKALGGI